MAYAIAILIMLATPLAVVISIAFLMQAQARRAHSSSILALARAHIHICELRANARCNNSTEACTDYVRALIDFYWAAFEVWRVRQIDDQLVNTWLSRLDPDEELATAATDGSSTVLRYRDVWDSLVAKEYFLPNDPFVAFMKFVHSGRIDRAIQMKI